jgi:branched-chain amino acid transport system ATP-binding protein
MLRIDNVHTYYGNSHVLQGVTMEVAPGSVVALLGRNGMGKTTLIRSVSGLTPPRTGRVVFKGVDVTGLSDFRRIRMGIGFVPQGRWIFPSLTVRENLLIGAERPGEWNLKEIYALFPRLEERSRHMGNKLSGGEQQMLAIARALMTNPDLLLMDEPTEGLAPMMVQTVADTILRLKSTGHTILLAEQNLLMALKVADFTHVLSRGRIVHSSSPQELWESEAIKKDYLGL